MEKFEYKVLTLSGGGILKGTSDIKWEKEMNNLGKEGWELVSVIVTSIKLNPIIKGIFKRKLK